MGDDDMVFGRVRALQKEVLGSIDRMITEYREKHGRWPKFAWYFTSGSPAQVEAGVGDEPPPEAVIRIDLSPLNEPQQLPEPKGDGPPAWDTVLETFTKRLVTATGGEPGFMVDFEVYSHRVEFKAWEITGQITSDRYGKAAPGRWIYGLDSNEDRHATKPQISGHVKWDGCTNFEFPEQDEGSLHQCDRSGLVALGEVLGLIHDEAMAACPNAEE